MRIPAEVVSPYINESDTKGFAEDKKAGPVENPARLRATLQRSPQEQRQAVDEGKPAVDENRERSPLRNRRRDRPVSKERREAAHVAGCAGQQIVERILWQAQAARLGLRCQSLLFFSIAKCV